MIFQFIPFVLMALLLLFILRQAQSGGSQALSFGRSRAKLLSENRPKVTFTDVAGVEEAKEELGEVVDFLKYPEEVSGAGRAHPQGRAAARDRRAPVRRCWRAPSRAKPACRSSRSPVRTSWRCSSASAPRASATCSNRPRSRAPCIVFIDEIDAVGRQRGAGLGGGHDEREQTLNQLLVEMDGFDQNTGVILIAATNRPDVLDPALLRPGRFDRQIVVDRADVRGRQAILAVHAKNKPLSQGNLARHAGQAHARASRARISRICSTKRRCWRRARTSRSSRWSTAKKRSTASSPARSASRS